jgi:hypothetical protein
MSRATSLGDEEIALDIASLFLISLGEGASEELY